MVKSVLYVTINFEHSNDILPQDFIHNFCDKLGYRPDNLIVEPYWKIAGQLQARFSFALGANHDLNHSLRETKEIATAITKEEWHTLGPEEDDEVVYELIYDGSDSEGSLKWAHLQLELTHP